MIEPTLHFTRQEYSDRIARTRTAMQEAGVEFIADAMGKSVDEAMPAILGDVPLGRMSEPDEVAAMAALIASQEGRGMTGSSVVISNGAYM